MVCAMQTALQANCGKLCLQGKKELDLIGEWKDAGEEQQAWGDDPGKQGEGLRGGHLDHVLLKRDASVTPKGELFIVHA